ncbi:MAG: UDP-N-acetylmuramate dehydrogenase [Magnetococcales bacterium]|nr:UDP-N-acetylmuramate dehydrogenase [Magnetococcales bacterium]
MIRAFPLAELADRVRHEEPLARRTTWRMGGCARWFLPLTDVGELAGLLRRMPPEEPLFLLGGGSNLLVADEGFDGCVIHLEGAFSACSVEREAGAPSSLLRAGAGLSTRRMAHIAIEAGLGGAEFLSAIPGSVGGALRMNAGAYGAEVADSLLSATLLDPRGELHHLPASALGLRYRHCDLPDSWIFLEATFRLHPEKPEVVRERLRRINRRRAASQPLNHPSAGSTFKNPPNGPKAWELIDDAGLRGVSRGGAQVSEKHSNFLINRGGATATEMRDLIALVQERVLARSGILLETEVILLGPSGRREPPFRSMKDSPLPTIG